MLKNSYNTSTRSKTGIQKCIVIFLMGEAFGSFFSDPEWENCYFETTEGDDVVEFSGGCTYQDADVTATLQFILDYGNGTFETGTFEMNEVPQNEIMTYAMITKVFDDYGKDTSEHSIDIE